MSSAPLALQGSAHADTFAGRFDSDLVDSLAYADVLPEGWREAADALVAQEMRVMPASLADYLQKLPVPTLSFQGAPLLAKQYEVHRQGHKVPPPDVARYRLEPPPPEARGDAGAWQKALDNAEAQLEHQGLRIANMELLLKYGANTWLAHNRSLEVAIKQYEAELEAVARATEDVNKARKLQQLVAGSELAKLEAQWRHLVTKNGEIERAVADLEARLGVTAEAAAAAGGGGDA